MAANGANTSPDVGVPHQPARFEATMNVALAKPARPRIDGAAIGWRKTRGRAKPSSQAASSTPAKAFARRSSSVLILIKPPFPYQSLYDVFCRHGSRVNLVRPGGAPRLPGGGVERSENVGRDRCAVTGSPARFAPCVDRQLPPTPAAVSSTSTSVVAASNPCRPTIDTGK